MSGEAGPIAMAPAAPDELRRAGLRLEAAAGTLNGLAGRGDVAGLDAAMEDHTHQREAFRAELEGRTGLDTGLIERWLAL